MKQQSLAVGYCSHERTEDVKLEGGATIAIRCIGCTKIVCQVGTCDGCSKQNWKLRKVVQKTRKRFCTEECYQQTLKRKQAEKDREEAERAARIAAQTIRVVK